MKKIRVEDAVGMTLCHDVTVMRDGFKGAAFRRGHVIRQEDIPKLLDIGKKTIFIWEDHAGEIHEEDAAIRMANMCAMENVRQSEVSEGKILFFAKENGMFRVDRELLREINSIGDLTISCLPDHYPVKTGDRLVSMRIVPLVTEEAQILQAETLCRDRPLFALRPYTHKKVGVIITGSEVYTGRIQDKFAPVVKEKLSQYPSEIVGITICDDDLDMICHAAEAHLRNGADFLIFTGGMSVDPDDLTSTAIRHLGAEILAHGVPAQPGNMTMVAYLDKVTIVGLPGAAIHLPTTIFDAFLPQIFTGDPLTGEDLIRLGDGGLCQLCGSCHWPNCTFGRY